MTETGGETVDVPVLVLVAIEVAADCESSNGAQRFMKNVLTEALNALMGLAPGRGTETMIVMFPMVISSILFKR